MILPTLARLALSTARLPAPRMMSTFGASTPFILLARAHVKPEFKEQHMEAAAVADNGVMESEPGMLHHTWDQVCRANYSHQPPADAASECMLTAWLRIRTTRWDSCGARSMPTTQRFLRTSKTHHS